MIEYNTQYFHKRNIEKAKRHAIKEFPNESVGIIVENKYILCKNIAKNKESDFRISPKDIIKAEEIGTIQAIIHSHNNHPHASKTDMDRQVRSEVPWGIINLKDGIIRSMFFWGDQLPIAPYKGRPFFHGVNDCYSLVRDYYKKELGIIIPIHPREYGFWKKDDKAFENLVLEGLEGAGFKIVSTDLNDLKLHDGVLGQINSPIINHTAVYLGRGLLLHHLCLHSNSLSNTVPINVYRDQIRYIVRHKDLM